MSVNRHAQLYIGRGWRRWGWRWGEWGLGGRMRRRGDRREWAQGGIICIKDVYICVRVLTSLSVTYAFPILPPLAPCQHFLPLWFKYPFTCNTTTYYYLYLYVTCIHLYSILWLYVFVLVYSRQQALKDVKIDQHLVYTLPAHHTLHLLQPTTATLQPYPFPPLNYSFSLSIPNYPPPISLSLSLRFTKKWEKMKKKKGKRKEEE